MNVLALAFMKYICRVHRRRECRSPALENERKLLHQMSSGCGTQQNDSKDEPTYAESLEMHPFHYPTTSNEHDSEMLLLNADGLTSTAAAKIIDASSIGSEYQSRRKTSTPTYGGSLTKNSVLNNPFGHMSPMSRTSNTDHRRNDSRSGCGSIRRLSSDQSINSISNDHDDVFSQPNLRDELLSCDQKELFQFLNDDFDNSHNYFSDTVGYGSAVIDPDTDSLLLFDAKRDANIFSPARKASTTSNKSNLSCISNSIFEALEHTRGGSISEAVDRQRKAAAAAATNSHCDELEPLVQDSEFENIIASFEKELNIIKNSTQSLQRQWSRASNDDSNNKGVGVGDGVKQQHSLELSSSTHKYEEILPMRLNSTNNSNTNNSNKNKRNSVNLKRRSLEKQMKVDDDFNVSNELKKICDHIQAPFTDSGSTDLKNNTANINNNKNISESTKSNANGGGDSGTNSSSSSSSSRVTATGATNETSRRDSVGSINSPTNHLCNISPKVRRKSDFHSSFDRIKRTSLIERVDESMQEDQMHHASSAMQLPPFEHHTYSEKLPRKHLNTDMNIESLSLKSTGSYEHLVCHNEKEPKKIRFEKQSDDTVNASSEPVPENATAKNADGGDDDDADKGTTFMIIPFE